LNSNQAELEKSKAELAELKDELKSAVKREAAKVRGLTRSNYG
jgi:hypothetical protein